MIPKLRTTVLAGVVTMGGLLAAGTTEARAQFVAATPGFSISVGNPYGAYGYGGYPGLYGAPAVAYPAPVIVPARPYIGGYYGGYRPYRPYGPVGYRPGFYGPRYGPYRRW